MTNSSFDFASARQAMVDSQLRPQGVNDPAVVEAMAAVPREQFVPEGSGPLAYLDRPVPVGGGRALSPPAATGLLLTALAPRAGQKALVVGSVPGYAAAVLERIGCAVSDGSVEKGHPASAPYDLIVVDGGIAGLPEPLVAQLRDGGQIGFASIDRGLSRLMIGRKSGGSLGLRSVADIGVPAIPGIERPRAFTF